MGSFSISFTFMSNKDYKQVFLIKNSFKILKEKGHIYLYEETNRGLDPRTHQKILHLPFQLKVSSKLYYLGETIWDNQDKNK